MIKKIASNITDFIISILDIDDGTRDIYRVWKNNCVNANNPEKRTKAKNAAKQGNAGERPDAAARYTVKSSGVNSLLFILHRYLPADKLRELEGGTLEVC